MTALEANQLTLNSSLNAILRRIEYQAMTKNFNLLIHRNLPDAIINELKALGYHVMITDKLTVVSWALNLSEYQLNMFRYTGNIE